MSDPLTFTVRRDDIVDCGHCDRPNATEIVSDTRTGRWGCEFDCIYCGEHNSLQEQGLGDEDGYVTVFVSLLVLGVLLVAVPLASLFSIPPAPWHLALILTGFAFLVTPTTLAAIVWLHRNGYIR